MQVHVRTTQNVFIHYPVASIGDRIVAHLLDLLIRILFAVALSAIYINWQMNIIWVWLLTLGVPWLLYHLLFEIFMDGQSPGKRIMEIKVLRLDGTPASLGDYLIRWIFGFVDLYLFSGLIAVLTVLIGGKGQRLGDVVAGTSVVKLIQESNVTAADIFVPHDDGYTPTFPQVVMLTDHDIELVQRALEVNRDSANIQPVMAVTEKIKSLTGIQTDLPPVKFLYTIIKDFQHLTAR